MALNITFHGFQYANGFNGASLRVLGPQAGDAEAVADNYTFPATGLFRCKADADHIVRFGGADLDSADGGELWSDGDCEIRFANAGDQVFVDTPA